MKKIQILLFSILLLSCNRHEKKTYYESGNIKNLVTLDENDKLEKAIEYYDLKDKNRKYIVIHFKNDYDSVFVYYKNGNLYKVGKKDKNGKAFGKWDYYTKEGFISESREYYIINNGLHHGSIVNQQWFYNKKRDTMYWSRENFNFYDQEEFRETPFQTNRAVFTKFNYFPTGDTISIAEPLRAIAVQRFAVMPSKGSECCVVIAKEKSNFTKDFSNEKTAKVDSFVCIGKDKLNRKYYPDISPKYNVVFGRWFDTPGKKIIRGYLVEYYKRKPTPNDSIVMQEAKVYFEKVIYVKDTIRKKKKNGL